ncbi:MAG TPA: phage tail protein [Candidatus Acidoferrales bacterium]|nr:phage tail protein [Candidatus Acidoferrales bacterium]
MIQFTNLMGYNFHIALMDSTNTVVDPNNLLAGTDSAPSQGSVSLALNVASSSVSAAVSAVGAVAGALLGGFQECTGLETSLEVEDYKEGGLNDRIRKFPSRVTWTNIVLKRGIGIGDDLWQWHADYINGTGKRRDGIIVLENDQHVPMKMWHFQRGLPIKWSGPALNAKMSEVAIESLEIVHEGLTLTSPASLASAAIGAASLSVGISL